MPEALHLPRDVQAELKALRLHGMAGAWVDLMEQGGNSDLVASRWLIEHLLQAESVNHSEHLNEITAEF